MHHSGEFKTTLLGSLAGLALAVPVAALAQENDGGLQYTLTFSQNLRDEDEGLQATSDIDFAISSVTRSQRFELNLGGIYEAGLGSDAASGFDDPTARLLYRYDTRNTFLETRLTFSRRDIEESVLLDEVDDTGLVIEEGQREDASAAVTFAWGQEAPFGGNLDASYRTRRFRDLTDTDLLDSENTNVSLRLDFEVNPQLTAFTTLSYRDTDRDGGVDSEVVNFNVGADFALSQSLTGRISLGQSRTSETGPGADPDRSGFSFDASLTQEMPNGALTGSLSSRLGENGRQSTLRLSRNIELRDGNFEAGIGFGEIDGEGSALFTLGFAQVGRRNSVSFRFDQSFSDANDGSAVLNSRLSANYQQDLTARSSFSFGVAYRDTNPVASESNGTEQLSVNFSYNQELTDRWVLTGGVSHTRRRSDSGAETTDDSIFVGLRTVLTWRP